jgi:hypothetical protein
MKWEVEYTDEFGLWWETLQETEQASVDAGVMLLEDYGPNLRFPYSSGINGSRHGNMRPFRILYAFDPRRCAILLLGSDKTGDNRWYEKNVPIADRLYDEHLEVLQKEGLIDGKKI